MKNKTLLIFFTLLFVNGMSLSSLFAQTGTFVSGSTGVDGAFNPTVSTTLTLPPNGVFNFSTVNIPTGVTVTFAKNAANTSVIILATGDVTIGGIIEVSGENAILVTPGEGGAGGFNGGAGSLPNEPGGTGLGPGGGSPGITVIGGPLADGGGGGGFGLPGRGALDAPSVLGGPSYGNPSLLPLIGGSGGGGGTGFDARGRAGGGGGGSILIASSTKITHSNGQILANGGNGASSASSAIGNGGGGSGGGIRLIANTIEGTGIIRAIGGSPQGGGSARGGPGGDGRIRFEAFITTFLSLTSPVNTSGTPGPIFIPSPVPNLTFTSVNGAAVPTVPTGSVTFPDITLPAATTNPILIGLAASNIPVGTSVEVSSIPEFGTKNTATVLLSGTDVSSTATASLSIDLSKVNVFSAQITLIQTASLSFPEIDGEKVMLARLGSKMGQKSQMTYITASGKKYPANKIGIWPMVRVDSRK